MINPVPLQPMQKIYHSRTPAQRDMYIQDLILKHPDILTIEEQTQVNRWKDYMLTGIITGVIAMPYSIYLGTKARSNPSLRSSYIKRMAFLATIPLVIVVVSGYYAEQHFRTLN